MVGSSIIDETCRNGLDTPCENPVDTVEGIVWKFLTDAIGPFARVDVAGDQRIGSMGIEISHQ